MDLQPPERTLQPLFQDSNTLQNTDGTNNGEDTSVWKSGTCRIDFIPDLVSAGEAKSVSNAVAQDYAQRLVDKCGDPNDSSAAFAVSSKVSTPPTYDGMDALKDLLSSGLEQP